MPKLKDGMKWLLFWVAVAWFLSWAASKPGDSLPGVPFIETFLTLAIPTSLRFVVRNMRPHPNPSEGVAHCPAEPILSPRFGFTNNPQGGSCRSSGQPPHISGVPETGPFCTSCGAKVDPAWTYCGNCAAPQSTHTYHPLPPRHPPPEPVASGPKKCPDCGLINPASAMRCDCGYSFS
jgi:hypothetical protein